MTTALLLLVLIPTAIFFLGLLLGLCVRLAPGTEWKVKLGRTLAYAQAWASGQDMDGRMLAALEMEWRMRRRYCKEPWQGLLYDAILERTESREAHHLSPQAFVKAAGRK